MTLTAQSSACALLGLCELPIPPAARRCERIEARAGPGLDFNLPATSKIRGQILAPPPRVTFFDCASTSSTACDANQCMGTPSKARPSR